MKKHKVTFTVHTWDLEINENNFSFNYSVSWDCGFDTGSYFSEHDWGDEIESFRKMLNDGYAAKLAIEIVL